MSVYFSPPEEFIIEELQKTFGASYIDACDHVIRQKRELAYLHNLRGNYELAKVILMELDEWNDDLESHFIQNMKASKKKPARFILP